MIVFASDHVNGSNTFALYCAAKNRGIPCIYKHRKGQFQTNESVKMQDCKIAITNNARWISNWPLPIKVNTQHGCMFLGTVRQENGIDLYLSYSNKHKDLMMRNGIREENIIVSTRPRVDFLYGLDEQSRVQTLTEMNLNPNKKTIMYAPTWTRDNFGGGTKGFFANWFDNIEEETKALISFLRNTKNFNVIFRLHDHYCRHYKHQVPDHIYSLVKNMDNVLITSMVTNPNSLIELFVSDLLITDYSSIAADYLALDRPIMFIKSHSDWIWNKENKWFITKEERTEFGYVIEDYDEFSKITDIMSRRSEKTKERLHYRNILVGNILNGTAGDIVLQKILEKHKDKKQ